LNLLSHLKLQLNKTQIFQCQFICSNLYTSGFYLYIIFP
jgi:hypothetical protein